MPNGDLSVGLADKAYISPRFKGRYNLFNAYNRVTARFEVSSDRAALEPVNNPHFTFHGPINFHLKATKDRARKDDALFSGICDVGIVIEQQGEMPWIRATTSPSRQLKSAGLAWSKVPNDDLPLSVPSEDCSIQIEVDFIRPDAIRAGDFSTWYFRSGAFAVRIRASMTLPRFATLSWFHSY